MENGKTGPAFTLGPEKKQNLRGLKSIKSPYPENLVEIQISGCAVWEVHISVCFSGLGGEFGEKIFEVIILLMNYIIKLLKILFCKKSGSFKGGRNHFKG